MPIIYDDIVIDADLKVDLLVNAQLMTYMKLLKKPQGLLINFFTTNITNSLKPIINEYFKDLPE
ncbi:GxxExxY protein [Kaistella jeonii]|uniref:GxxExxY protein n=1 Tax=Kaistella jeonii TaxID=266749 RepID=UPI000A472544|nr:GxxExxY protein [Kaistella jeonii]